MRSFQKYRYEFLVILLTAALFIIAFYFGLAVSDETPSRSALLTFLIADAIALFFALRRLWRTKWKKSFLVSMQKIFSKIAQRFAIFIEKRTKGEKITVLSGKTTVSFDFPLQELDKQKSPKAIKWKRLKNDRERLGYLYKHMIEYKIKHGSVIYSSSTPSEVKYQNENEVVENRIFDIYIDNRYKQMLDTDTEILDGLKNELNYR